MTTPRLATMRAVQYDGYGDAEVLKVRRLSVPSPGPDEVLVRVHASGLNPKDVMIRSGAMRVVSGRTFPRGTGFDFAGEVVRSGAEVTDLAPGEPVWGFLDGVIGGAAAEYLVTPRRWIEPMPDRIDWVEAAAIPLVASAALQALRDVARLRPGERVLIKGASGGVGSAAIQIADAMGAHVTAIATGEGLEQCRALGTSEVMDYRITDPATRPERFDVYLDCVGQSPLIPYARLLGRGGRWIAVAPSVPIYALSPLSRVLSPLLGVPSLGFVVVKPRSADLREIARLVDRGLLRMPVSATYSLDAIGEAHDQVAAGHARGKRVLVVSPEAAGNASARGDLIAAKGRSTDEDS